MTNRLHVSQRNFKDALKPFAAKRRKLGPALLAFEGGFLSIESGEATAVMHATGEWHGRARFSAEILRALATYPPPEDPVTVSYAEDHLLIGSMTIPCQWDIPFKAIVQDLVAPGLVDLLAMDRTLPRAEIAGTGLRQAIRSAKEKAERRISNAAAQLKDLDVSENEIRDLVEAKIRRRLGC